MASGRRALDNGRMRSAWSFRFLRPFLFRREAARKRRALAESRGVARPLAAGEAAPAFVLPDDEGRPRRSEEWIGRKETIVWFTNLCAICAEQAAVLSAAKRRGALFAEILAIHLPGRIAPAPVDFRRRSGSEFPILIDDGSVGRAWTGEAVPDT